VPNKKGTFLLAIVRYDLLSPQEATSVFFFIKVGPECFPFPQKNLPLPQYKTIANYETDENQNY
jgi:hypothetical protein